MANVNGLLCHFSIILEDGSTADDTRSIGQPARFNFGDQSLNPAMEAELCTLKAGDKHQFTLEAADAFGEVSPNMIQQMDRSRFPDDITPEVGLIIGFTAPNGDDVPGVIREVGDETVTVDLNHPLAGQKVTFDVEVLEEL